jgi:hypothetical protein
MNTPEKWRMAALANDANLLEAFVDLFTSAYEANNKPDNMAMFTHNDSFGAVMGVSITPQSIPYCPFSVNWIEITNPGEFGLVGWAAGGVRLK